MLETGQAVTAEAHNLTWNQAFLIHFMSPLMNMQDKDKMVGSGKQ